MAGYNRELYYITSKIVKFLTKFQIAMRRTSRLACETVLHHAERDDYFRLRPKVAM